MAAYTRVETKFKREIWSHYRRLGRHDLPWRHTRDPYAILVSEIMLQQTQVSRVEGYYPAFIKKFPTFRALAAAKTGDVLEAWQGLGYNRRALALKKTAEIVVRDFHGKLPADRATLESLPGIGRGTSGSLIAFAFNKPVVFVETNIRRVFLHFFFSKKKKVTDEEVERYILRVHEVKRPREWYWALMDYGASMKIAHGNPNVRSAHYHTQARFAGSDRELRGRLLRLMVQRRRIEESSVPRILQIAAARAETITRSLCREGFIVKKGAYLHIAS